MTCYYKLLNVSTTANPKEIKKAYYKLGKSFTTLLILLLQPKSTILMPLSPSKTTLRSKKNNRQPKSQRKMRNCLSR